MEEPAKFQPIAAALDAAVLSYYPEYAAASNISGSVQELVRGVVGFYFTLHEQARQRQASGRRYTDEFVDTAVNDALELIGMAYSISLTRHTASPVTKKLLFSSFLDDMTDYHYCIDTLLRCVAFK